MILGKAEVRLCKIFGIDILEYDTGIGEYRL